MSGPATFAYAVIGVVVAVSVAVAIRRGFQRDYPRLDNDRMIDWTAYVFIGSCCGFVWPITVPLLTIAALLRHVFSRVSS